MIKAMHERTINLNALHPSLPLLDQNDNILQEYNKDRKLEDIDYYSFVYLTSFLSRADLRRMWEAGLDGERCYQHFLLEVLECWDCNNVDENGKLYHCACGHSMRDF